MTDLVLEIRVVVGGPQSDAERTANSKRLTDLGYRMLALVPGSDIAGADSSLKLSAKKPGDLTDVGEPKSFRPFYYNVTVLTVLVVVLAVIAVLGLSERVLQVKEAPYSVRERSDGYAKPSLGELEGEPATRVAPSRPDGSE